MGNDKAGIDFFSTNKEYGWLSNFHRAVMVVDGKPWRTVEHYYQAMKAVDKATQERIRLLESPAEARLEGRRLKLREDWDEVKVPYMLRALRAKFSQNPDLRLQLLATGNNTLHEDNPSDLYWGKRGNDMLGKLLMKVRSELK